ncbi:MAG TPA: hypothetical protein VFP47_15715, partial [Pyrinomonadaceae bacterium]|nr:hypothetical protein [Pyrinomonadaceae bacterium]
EDPPELSETNKTVSPALERVVRHCLEKNPAERFYSARDLGFAIESFSGAVTSDARLEIIETVVGVAEPPKHEETRRLSWSRALPWAIAGLAILIAVTAFYFRKPSPDVSNAGVRQFTLAQPAEGPLDLTFGGSILLSPDGGHLVSSIRAGGKRQLFYRALSSANAQPLDGTQGASDPFFSPDGKWLAFFANGLLKKVSLSGGAPEIICKAQNPRGGVWEKANSVVFTPDTDAPLYRVSAGGGPVQPISALDSSNRERSHRWPDVLPSGKAVVFTAAYEVGNPMDDASIAVLDLSTGKHKTLIKGGSFARYVPTGHLVYARRGALVAIPFDAQTLELKGVPVTVQEELLTTVVNGRAQYSFSRTGDFVYIRDQSTSKANVGQLLDWVDRRGGAKELINVRHEYSAPRLSPDGRTLFVEIADPAAAIWVYDFERGTLSPLTQAGVSYGPIPSPDGRRIAYQATRDGVTGVMMAQSDGTSEERLTSDKRFNFPTSWSPDGKQLLITAANESGYSEVRLLEPDGDRKQRTFLQGPFNTGGAMFSPNGRWVAYVSDESTRNEVYVRS